MNEPVTPGYSPSSRRLVWIIGASAALLVATVALIVFRPAKPASVASVDSGFTAAEVARPLLPAEETVRPLQQAREALTAAVTAGSSGGLQPAEVGERLQVTFDALSRVSEKIPRQTFDLDAIVTIADRDPMRLLAWVRAETALVPYEGVLRGSVGVLLDRFGNSLDRSLLLHELLVRSGHEVRLARAQLPADRASALLQSIRTTAVVGPSRSVDPTAELVDEFLESYARRFGGDPAVLRARVRAIRDTTAAVGAEAARRAEVQGAALMQVAGQRLAETLEPAEPAQLRALADHWWVQQRQGERWVDFDPSGIVGDASLAPSSTLQPDQIGDEMRHTLTVRVSIECACGKGLEERLVVEHTVRLSEVIGAPLSLRQLPAGPELASTLAGNANDGTRVRAWLEAQKEWTVALSVGPKELEPATFTLRGEVHRAGIPKAASSSGALLGGLAGEEAETANGAGQLTAESVDFELRSPGSPATTERRYLFDWIGPNARWGGGTVPGSVTARPLEVAIQTEVLALSAQPSAEFVAYLAAATTLAHHSSLVSALRESATADSATADDSALEGFPAELYALALARRDWSRYAERIYFSQANVLSRHRSFGLDGVGTLRELVSFDIISNRVDVLPGQGVDPAVLRLKQGVLDSNAEVLISTSGIPVTNIAEAQARTGSAGRWELKEGSTEPQHHLDVTNGHFVVVRGGGDARSPSSDGWWRIDSKTGTALAMTPSGWGGTQGMAEFARLNEQQIRTAGIIFRFMMAAHCHVSAMRATLGESYRSAGTAAAASVARAAVCQAGAYLGVRGIAVGGAYGNLLSRSGDMFSIAFSLSSYF